MGRDGPTLLQPALFVAFLLQEYHPRSTEQQRYGPGTKKHLIVLSKMGTIFKPFGFSVKIVFRSIFKKKKHTIYQYIKLIAKTSECT